MLKLFCHEINFKNRTSLCSSNRWWGEKQIRWVLARRNHCPYFKCDKLEGGYRSHVRTPQAVFSLLVAFVKFFSPNSRRDYVLCVHSYSMPDGGIILILLLLGWGGGKSPERLCLGSSGLQTACWGPSLPTASTRNLTHLHLKLIIVNISLKHTSRFYYKLQK